MNLWFLHVCEFEYDLESLKVEHKMIHMALGIWTPLVYQPFWICGLDVCDVTKASSVGALLMNNVAYSRLPIR